MGNIGAFLTPLAVMVLFFLTVGLFSEGFDNNPSSGSHAIAGAIIVAGALIALAIYYRPQKS